MDKGGFYVWDANRTRNNQERNRIGEKIHNVLKGNPDYVNNAIVLNIDRDRRVRLWLYDESETRLNMVATEEEVHESR